MDGLFWICPQAVQTPKWQPGSVGISLKGVWVFWGAGGGVRVINCIPPRFSCPGLPPVEGHQLPKGPSLAHVVVCGTTVKESERNKNLRRWLASVSGEKGKCPMLVQQTTPGWGGGA